ncbi:MAG: hypothetical protein K6T86_20290, partial [Pirellulales bacterium]|nr:hypothetical protein [Pirellulales bacterium]
MAPDPASPPPTTSGSASSEVALQARVLAGRYELSERIGAGGMGVVHRRRAVAGGLRPGGPGR